MRFALCFGVSCFGTHIWRIIFWTTDSPWQFCATRRGKSAVNGWWVSVTSKRRFFIIFFPHKLYKVVRNDGWPPTALLTMRMLSTCCKLSEPATHHLLTYHVRSIYLAQVTVNFDRRYALCIHKLYQRPHFIVGGSSNYAPVRLREVPLVHASCDIISLSRKSSYLTQ